MTKRWGEQHLGPPVQKMGATCENDVRPCVSSGARRSQTRRHREAPTRCDVGADRWSDPPVLLIVFRVSEDVETFTDVPFPKPPLLGSGRTGDTPGSPTIGSPSSLFARTHP